MIKFLKDSDILFNRNDLACAIMLKTDNPREQYKVSIRNNYPCICIGHEHYYVHRLLGELYFGNLVGMSIHHIDGDKRNNSKENLLSITNSEHAKLHHCGNDFRKRETVSKCVSIMSEKRRRNDIDENEVKMFREHGLTYKELSERFKCGQSVIRRCLKQ